MAVAFGDESLRWLASQSVQGEVDLTLLVQEHARLLYRLAFSVVRSPTDAEDIVQETFLRALQHRQKLKELDSVRAWLLRVAWNLAMDRKRRVPPAQLDEKLALRIVSPDLPPDERLANAADLTRVVAALDTLPESERAVLLLAAFEELSVAEIATALGKSASSVRSLTFRARTHLEQELNGTKRSANAARKKGRSNSVG